MGEEISYVECRVAEAGIIQIQKRALPSAIQNLLGVEVAVNGILRDVGRQQRAPAQHLEQSLGASGGRRRVERRTGEPIPRIGQLVLLAPAADEARLASMQ